MSKFKYPWYCKGGKRRSNGRFSTMINGKFEIGLNHIPMTGINRMALFNRNKLK